MATMDALQIGQKVLHQVRRRSRPCRVVEKLNRRGHAGTRIRVAYQTPAPGEEGPQTVQIAFVTIPLTCSRCGCIAAWPCDPACSGPTATGGCAHCARESETTSGRAEPGSAGPLPHPARGV